MKAHCIGCYIYNNDNSVNLSIYSLWLMMMFETSKHVPKSEEHCVFKNNYNTCAIKTI